MSQMIDHMSQCLWLSEMNNKGGVTMADLKNLLRDYGNVNQIKAEKKQVLIERFSKKPERTNQLIAFLNNRSVDSQLRHLAEKAIENGIRAVSITDEIYPERLRNISSSPLVLYFRGENYVKIFSSAFFATIIGTRTPTAYGRIVTEQICSDLARQGVVIISGMARGIDSIAHEAALAADGLTVAVVGNGPDVVYPPENKDLMAKIADQGVIISEHPPGTMPLKKYFPARNRILSGLSDAVAVIEASTQSGTMITASFAGDQGKDIYAVPGSILSPFSSGCNQLIREGAEVLTRASDMLWRLPAGQFQSWLEQTIRQQRDEELKLPDNHQPSLASQIIHALTGHAMTLDEIAGQLDIELQKAAMMVSGLEIDGLIQAERSRYSLTRKALCSI